MKNLSITFSTPYIFVKWTERTLAVPSMVLSTLFACYLTTFHPELATLWMQLAVVPPRS